MYPLEIDWLKLWRDLVKTGTRSRSTEEQSSFYARFRRKSQEKPDPLLNFVLQDIANSNTVLDIGAGSGRWSITIARIARSVTAVEPADHMLSMLRDNISAAGLNNVQIVQATWENAVVEPHDIVVCVHGIYFSPDFAAFVRKMEKYARKRCYLALRLPPYDGIISDLSLKIYGHRHDSTNAIIAYNALYSMGIYANVLVEDDIRHWVDSTFEQAFARARRHLHLESKDSYDELIKNTLAKRLMHADNTYVWPDGTRLALLWWSPLPVNE